MLRAALYDQALLPGLANRLERAWFSPSSPYTYDVNVDVDMIWI